MLKQFVSNPIGLIIYGLLNALFASFFSSDLPYEVIFITGTASLFLVVGYAWAASTQSELFMQSFPGQVRFTRVLIRFTVINTQGDGEVSYSFEGVNESNTPRRRLGFLVDFDSSVPPTIPVDGTLDGRPVKWDATMVPQTPAETELTHYNLAITFDLRDLCGPRTRLPQHSLSVKGKGMYAKAFDGPFDWRLRPVVYTDEIVFQLDTDPSVRIDAVWENVEDFWGEPDAVDLRRLREAYYARKLSENSARFLVKRPIPSNMYHFYFNLKPALTNNPNP